MSCALEAEKIDQLVREDLSLDPQHTYKKLEMAGHASGLSSLSTGKAETRGSRELTGWPESLLHSGFSERPCLKNQSGEIEVDT